MLWTTRSFSGKFTLEFFKMENSMAAHNHHDLMNWKNGLLKGQPNKPSNKKIVVAIIIGLVLVGAYTLYS
jgi:hypothetical protein